jgi:predicted DNA-binding transcriptional regulator AlpA
MKPTIKPSATPRESVSMKPEDILTPDQLAERLQVKRSWVYEKCRRRAKYSDAPMPCLNLGRYLRFYWPDICEWLRHGDRHGEKSPRR